MDGSSHPTLSYAHGTSGTPLLGQTIGDNLRATVSRYGECEALVVRSRNYRVTYRQLWDVVGNAARGLLALGVNAGDRVGIWATNCPEWVLAQYATARIGAILVNINPAYQSNELEYVLRQSGVRVLLHGRGLRQTLYAPMLEAVRPRCPELRHVLQFDRDWDDLLRSGQSVSLAELERRESQLQCDDAINIQYTSGTTGSPKGATLTHHNILNNGYFTGLALNYSERDRVCIPVPLYHCFGVTLGNLACTATGACMVYPGETFQASTVLRTIHEERCTALYGVPTMFRAILEQPDFDRFDCTSLRTGIMSGAPCPIELMKQVVERLHIPQIAIAYGMTETSPLSTISGLDDPLDLRVSTVGRVMPHAEISVRDADTGRIVPRGAAGEFCARGYHVMRGYWNDESASNAAIDAAGWMHSGDLAVMDEDGSIHIVGRLKDMIIRGGENISPREIEEVLLTHAAVAEAQVIGVPSHKYGEDVMAWIRPCLGATACQQELEAHCRARLASFKTPRYWHFVETFPMTVTGKIQKFRLRQLAIELLNLQQEASEKTA